MSEKNYKSPVVAWLKVTDYMHGWLQRELGGGARIGGKRVVCLQHLDGARDVLRIETADDVTGNDPERLEQRPVSREGTMSATRWGCIDAGLALDARTVEQLYGISRGSEMIFHRYSGLIHQRAISKAEYEYELARRQAGSEMGGLFTPQPSALPTNIHCLTSSKHVIGFVGCSLNTSKYRFFLDAPDFSIKRPPIIDTRIWLVNPTEEECIGMVNRGFFLCEWEDALQSADHMLHTAWATKNQLDVRYQGAYIEVPDFWMLKENVSY